MKHRKAETSAIHAPKLTGVTGFRDIYIEKYDLLERNPAISRRRLVGVAEDIHRRLRELNAPDSGAFEYVSRKN